MANLAIKGHITRGNEVIALLEMLGGNNIDKLIGIYYHNDCAYTIDSTYKIEIVNCRINAYSVLTLEEFLEKYPFKIGDKVLIPEYESEVRICKMRWDPLCNYIEYMVYRNEDPEWCSAEELLNYNDDFLIDKDNKDNMEKINIAEILKECPSDMELDSPLVDGLYFDKVTEINMIKCYTKRYYEHTSTCNSIYFYSDGSYLNHTKAKCVIFPKGKTTWEGFEPPIKFKDGDIVTDIEGAIFIYQEISVSGYCGSFVSLDRYNQFISYYEPYLIDCIHLATEEEKQKLFQAIKENGYRWNGETKTLEKLIKPKFKVGDKIEKCRYRFTIAEIKDDYYLTKCGNKIPIENQDDFRLVPNKFDITTLVPFESKVLVRDNNYEFWKPTFWGYRINDKCQSSYTLNGLYRYCIPYEHNEHLLGSTEDCDDFYKTWEK